MADDLAPVAPETTSTPAPGDAALASLAKSDDATRYIEQRRDDGEDAGAEPEAPTNGRADKIEQALEEARARSRQAQEVSQQLDKGLEQAEAEWAQQQALEKQADQQRANELSYYEARGRTMQRAEQLKQTNPTLHATIANNLMELERALDPDQARAIEQGLVFFPEVVWQLGELLSDDRDGTTMSEKIYRISQDAPEAMWRDIVQQLQALQIEKHVQARILQDRAFRSKKVTSAPPPITPPRDRHQG
jgi:hypothetical protein